ncbi:dynein axonemal assembly factor 8-like [Glandiceps talaboti]
MSNSRKQPKKEHTGRSNHSFEFVALPEGTGLKPQLDTIFAEVQASLPSIDFELSDASSDEEVSIFNRSLRSPSDPDTYEDDRLSPVTWQNVLLPSQNQQDDHTLNSLDHNNIEINHLDNDSVNDEEFTQSWDDVVKLAEEDAKKNEKKVYHSMGTSTDAHLSDDKESIDEDKDLSQEKDLKIDKNENVKSLRENLPDEMSKKEVLQNSIYSSFLPTETPQLSMQKIADIDIDELLGVIDQEKGSSETLGEGKDSSLYTSVGDSVSVRPESSESQTLMDKLAQLCIQQSGGSLTQEQLGQSGGAGRTRRLAWTEDTTSSLASGDSGDTQRHRQQQQKQQRQQPKSEKTEEKETIFLDLRDFDKKKQEQAANKDAIQRILGIQKDTSDDLSDDGSEDDLSTWHEQRRHIRDTITSGKVPTEDMWATSKKPTPYKPTRKVRKIRKSEVYAQQNQNEVKSVQNDITEKKADSSPDIAVSIPEPSKPEPSKQTLQTETKEEEKQRKLEAAKKVREQREQERQTRLRLQRQLETLRPRCSASGKHRCADNTPTVFDLEASYEPAPQTLPPILKAEQECIMLNIHISSNGEVISHRSSGNRNVDNTTGISATYATLLTWLLSLVPENYDFLQHDVAAPSSNANNELPSTEAPFYVIGLQQLWQEKFLSLAVAITPRDKAAIKNTPAKKKSRVRDEFKDCSPFQKSVAKFLSTNVLNSVCPWLQSSFAYKVGSKGQMLKSTTCDSSGVQKDGSYMPPLPAVTSKPLSTFVAINRDPNAVSNVFGSSVGFFWQTVECEENVLDQDVCQEYNTNSDIQNTLSLIYKNIYRDPYAMVGVLYGVLQEGLDLCGIRLLYPTGNFIPSTHSTVSVNDPKLGGDKNNQSDSDLNTMNTIGAIVALALRGHGARSKWLDAVGPSDPQLARRTDPQSLCAKFGGESRDEVWLFCPRNPARINSELARWFGGRVPPNGVIDVGVTNPMVSSKNKRMQQSPNKKKAKKGSYSDEQSAESDLSLLLPNRRPPATLTATTCGDVFLVISPLIPTQYIGFVLSVCHNRGFQVRGIRRMRMSVKRANNMGIQGTQLAAFCPIAFHTPTSPMNLDDAIHEQLESGPSSSRQPPRPGTVLLLRKENATHQVHSLIEALMVKLSLLGLLREVQISYDDQVKSCHCFHAAAYSDNLLQCLGGDFTRTPHHETRSSVPATGHFYSNAELEQVVVITLSGVPTMKCIGNTLGKTLALIEKPCPSDNTDGLELLGIKWLPALTTIQAKEITPFEVGDRLWQTSIHSLMSSPTLICVFRGINAFQQLHSVLNIPKSVTGLKTTLRSSPLTTLMSPSAEVAYRQAAMFFHDRELYADPTMRPNLKYLPPVRTGHMVTPGTPGSPSDYWTNDDGLPSKGNKSKKHGGRQRAPDIVYIEESIYDTMLSGPRPLTTVAVIKPDALHRHLAKLLKRICQEGFSVIGMRLEVLSRDDAKVLVPAEDKTNEVLCNMHLDYLTSGPVLLLCLQRENAIKKLLDVVGPVNPQEAKKVNQFLWRSLFGVDPINNGLHASCSYSGSVLEQKLFFSTGLCCQETPDLRAEKLTCPANDPIIDNGIDSKYTYVVKDSVSSTNGISTDGLASMCTTTRSMGTSTSSTDLLPIHSSICQTNCVVFMPQLQISLTRSRKPGYIQLIDAFVSLGFHIVGLRMVWFTLLQAQHFVSITPTPNPHLAEVLCQGPSIAIAIERDNAVTCFDQILMSPFQGELLLSKYGKLIMRPKDTTQATKFLEFFFDKLMPNSQRQILPTQ